MVFAVVCDVVLLEVELLVLSTALHLESRLEVAQIIHIGQKLSAKTTFGSCHSLGKMKVCHKSFTIKHFLSVGKARWSVTCSLKH